MRELKIAILVDDTKLEKYKVEIINELIVADFCTISKIINIDKESDTYDQGSKYLFYRWFNKLDALSFGKGTKYLKQEPIPKIDLVDAKEPDLIINLSSSTKYYENSAKYGMWQFVYNSSPLGYWEVINNDPYTTVNLEKAGNGFESGLLLDTFRTATDRKSMLKNRDLVSWRTHMMMVRNIKLLAQNGESYFEDKKILLKFNHDIGNKKRKFFDLQFKFSDQTKQYPPTNCQMLVASCKLIRKYARFSLRKFFTMDRWLILYSQNRDGEVNPNLSEYKRFYAPSENYFVADPFVVDEGEKSYLFYEELDYATSKGYLKVAEFDDEKGDFKEPQMILEEEYHLSYPNVFKHEGKYYMIPESYENKTVDLYECIEFPTKWEKKKTLLENVSAVDATLYFQDKKWWMFVNIARKEGFSMNDELYIYHAKDFLKDEWISHSKNPVVCDVVTARAAGNLIKKDGKLYRPAQDCSGFYGRKIVINEVLKLSEDEYKEQLVGEINSDFSDDLVAVHTLNCSKKLTVIDAIKSR